MHIPMGAGQPSSIRPQRLLKLESLLKGGSVWSVRQLAQLFGVGLRTIRRDIRLLRNCDVPIIYDPHRGGYRAPSSKGIRAGDGLAMEVAELVALVLAVKHVGHLPDCFAEPCDLAIEKIMQAVPPDVRQQAIAILDLYPPRFAVQPDRLELVSNTRELEAASEKCFDGCSQTLELPQRQSG